MQERLAGGPHAALGISQAATAAEIRAAFLQLTKTYHPARFGYMSSELQKLSNEVFLLLRAAHDAIARPARAAAAARADRSGNFPAIGSKITGPLPVQPAAISPARAAPGGRSTSPSLSAPPAPVPAPSRTTTPPSGMRLGVLRPPAQPGQPAPPRPGALRPTPLPVPARLEDRELATALEHMQRGQWDAARAILAALAARAPDVPRFRALQSYARGREAQLAHRLDEARVELQDALQIDPDLSLAKTALAELFTRRK